MHSAGVSCEEPIDSVKLVSKYAVHWGGWVWSVEVECPADAWLWRGKVNVRD